MVAYYTIFGQKVGTHVLSMATLASTGGLAWFFMGGKKKSTTEPPINAKSKEEETFVKDYLKQKGSEGKTKQ